MKRVANCRLEDQRAHLRWSNGAEGTSTLNLNLRFCFVYLVHLEDLAVVVHSSERHDNSENRPRTGVGG